MGWYSNRARGERARRETDAGTLTSWRGRSIGGAR